MGTYNNRYFCKQLSSGKLYIVPTPIGNLGDITYRAIEVLKEVDAILCEDTRQTKKLIDHYEVEKKLIPFHQHNEHKNLQVVIKKLQDGVINNALKYGEKYNVKIDEDFALIKLYEEVGEFSIGS